MHYLTPSFFVSIFSVPYPDSPCFFSVDFPYAVLISLFFLVTCCPCCNANHLVFFFIPPSYCRFLLRPPSQAPPITDFSRIQYASLSLSSFCHCHYSSRYRPVSPSTIFIPSSMSTTQPIPGGGALKLVTTPPSVVLPFCRIPKLRNLVSAGGSEFTHGATASCY